MTNTTNTKDKVLIGLIVVLILLLIGSHIKGNCDIDRLLSQVDDANKQVLELDEVKKEADGQYAKLVDTYKTEKELKDRLKESNISLYKQINNQNERILMLNNTVISLESKYSNGNVTVNDTDTNSLDLSLRYPSLDSSFINWDGSISITNRKYSGKWSFNKLPIEILLTETERGMWNWRLIGPDWLKVDSMKIESLSKKDIVKVKVKDKKFGFIAGGGLNTSLDNSNNSIRIGAGLYYNNDMLILNASTLNIIGLEYYHRFSNSKNK